MMRRVSEHLRKILRCARQARRHATRIRTQPTLVRVTRGTRSRRENDATRIRTLVQILRCAHARMGELT
eukprot:379620-Prymnesium_polylepis.2